MGWAIGHSMDGPWDGRWAKAWVQRYSYNNTVHAPRHFEIVQYRMHGEKTNLYFKKNGFRAKVFFYVFFFEKRLKAYRLI